MGYTNKRSYTFYAKTSVYTDSANKSTRHTVHTSPGYNQSTQTEPCNKYWVKAQSIIREKSEQIAFVKFDAADIAAMAKKAVYFDASNNDFIDIGLTGSQYVNELSSNVTMAVQVCKKETDLSTLTYDSMPGLAVIDQIDDTQLYLGYTANVKPTTLNSVGYATNESLKQAIINGLAFSILDSSPTPSSSSATSFGISDPIIPSRTALGVHVADIQLEAEDMSPSGNAYVPPDNKCIVTWNIADIPYYFTQKPAQASFSLQYYTLTDGVSNGTKTISGGAGNTATIPVSDLTGAEALRWRIKITSDDGIEGEWSAWQFCTCVDPTGKATAISPVNTIVDGTKDVIFQWKHVVSSGAAQSKAELQKSTDGSTWTALATIDGTARQWACPAGTLTSSIKYWRVRTYNADGVAGDWSDAAQIVVVSAPDAPQIRVDSVDPRPKISWTATDQEAWQVELDGEVLGGTHYGAEKTWKSPMYLMDGSHTVRVRVQNQYGMWSSWCAAALPVTNTPGAGIGLIIQVSSKAVVTWQAYGSYDFYLVYRNGKPIAKLTQTQYTDELSSGSTTYQVRGCYDDSGNYGLSPESTVTVKTGQYATLYGIASGKKVTLKHCGLKNQPVQNAINRDIQYIFMYGSTYPHAERSEFVTKKVGGTAVFLPGEDKAGFDALIGELVCLKTQSGEMVIGYLNETSDVSRVNPDKSVVNFSIQQIDYAEVIDIDS